MFNWFKKAPKTHYQRLDDVVWASTAARQRGIACTTCARKACRWFW
jgi:hypothetical protein